MVLVNQIASNSNHGNHSTSHSGLPSYNQAKQKLQRLDFGDFLLSGFQTEIWLRQLDNWITLLPELPWAPQGIKIMQKTAQVKINIHHDDA